MRFDVETAEGIPLSCGTGFNFVTSEPFSRVKWEMKMKMKEKKKKNCPAMA